MTIDGAMIEPLHGCNEGAVFCANRDIEPANGGGIDGRITDGRGGFGCLINTNGTSNDW